MPQSTLKGTPHLRKQRFCDEELIMLVDTLAQHADVVFSTDLRRATQMRKKKIWEEVAQKVSAVGTTTCNTKECRKRWDDLRLRVRNMLTANRQQAQATGSEPSTAIKLPQWEAKTAPAPLQPTHVDEEGTATSSNGDAPQSPATSDPGEVAQSARDTAEDDVQQDEADKAGQCMSEDTEGTPSMGHTPQHSLGHGLCGDSSGEETAGAIFSPQFSTSPAPMQPPAIKDIKDMRDLEARITRMEERQQSMDDMLRQFIAVGEAARQAHCDSTHALTRAVNRVARWVRQGMESVTQALKHLAATMAQCPAAPAKSRRPPSTSSTPANSDQPSA
ncbi:myb-related transcription factor, partner of profilin-like [Ambystoma mexicanum]|uniref:myb-related transcription factor, partner of profilin-like n=1 Tax=Ambystoma mexicanum TaxID=8296 RepID=UPI0037E862F7